MTILAIALSTVLALVTLLSTICVINQMDRKTPFLRRLAFIVLGTGSAAMLVAPTYLQRPPALSEILLLLALALLSFTERTHHRSSDQTPVTNP